MSEYTKFHVGANVFVLRKNSLLLGKRKNIYGDGSWGLPGGHLEYKEEMKEATRRELKEETGLDATDFQFVNLVNDTRQDEHYLQVGFLAKDVVDDKEPKLMEPDRCEEWKWFDLDNLPENIFVGHIKQIQAFKENRYFIDGTE
ncbi:MAG: NUDIX domain-containing protein [Parcubacteria group bacterium]|nr:NUDIX domain-containing protein [Parcubacteria group bacterium]